MPRPRRRLPRFTDRLRLSDTDLRVSPVCLGKVRSDRTIAAAFEAGINFFFLTADMHWPLYEASRRGLEKLIRSRRGIRDQIVVAAASYVTQPEFCTMPFTVFKQLVQHPLTDLGLKKFLADWEKQNVPKG